MRRIACLLLILLLVFSVLGSVFIPYSRGSKTWIVDSQGSGDFTTISAAINAAYNWDTIYVKPGIYGGWLRIEKPLTIIGENPATTIIDCKLNTPGIQIVADYVTISGFWVTGYPQYVFYIQKTGVNHVNINGNIIQPYTNYSYPYYTPIAFGLITDGGYNSFCNNNLSNVAEGVLSVGASSYNTFNGNRMYVTIAGLCLDCSSGNFRNATVTNNIIYGRGVWGILISNGYNNLVQGNTIADNFTDGAIMQSNTHDDTIIDNDIVSNGDFNWQLPQVITPSPPPTPAPTPSWTPTPAPTPTPNPTSPPTSAPTATHKPTLKPSPSPIATPTATLPPTLPTQATMAATPLPLQTNLQENLNWFLVAAVACCIGVIIVLTIQLHSKK